MRDILSITIRKELKQNYDLDLSEMYLLLDYIGLLNDRIKLLEAVREAADKCIGTMRLDDLYYRIHKLGLVLKDCEAGE